MKGFDKRRFLKTQAERQLANLAKQTTAKNNLAFAYA